MKTQICTETVLKHYLVCALWSSTDEAGEPLDATFTPEDIAPESTENARGEIADFLALIESEGIDASAWSDEQIGHDFWLTRNGHGAGFWDRSDRENGRLLTALCKPYGTTDAYVGDDGRVYLT